MAQRKGISSGTTAQRSIEEAGKMRFNTSTNLMEYYDGTSWKSIDSPPLVSSVSPANLLTGDGTGNYTIVVTGSSFSTNVTAEIITDGGVSITPDTTTRNSSTQATLVVAKNKANLTNANEPFDVKISNTSGLAGTLADALNIDAQPVFQTAAGSLYSGNSGGYSAITIAAHDPESGADPTYTLESGSIPAGLSFASTSSGAVISGTQTVPGSNTTSTFTIRAKDAASNISDRQYTITITAPVTQSFTSSGTFSVPSGISAVDVLVIAGGGSGGGSNNNAVAAGGGGAGGLIYRPSFPVTPGGTVSVTVGSGGQANVGAGGSHPGPTHIGQDSVFGTLTAKGGGGGGSGDAPGHPDGYNGNKGQNGGSGGGTAGWGATATPGAPTPSGIQPTQPGDSGTYGFGTAGGTGGNPGTPSGSGGGSGAAGTQGGQSSQRAGGAGKAYNISGSSVTYAGGGGSGGQGNIGGNDGQPGSGGAGGGGNAGSQGNGGADGSTNRGSGGGGCGASQGNQLSGGAGGKGIVIVTY